MRKHEMKKIKKRERKKVKKRGSKREIHYVEDDGDETALL